MKNIPSIKEIVPTLFIEQVEYDNYQNPKRVIRGVPLEEVAGYFAEQQELIDYLIYLDVTLQKMNFSLKIYEIDKQAFVTAVSNIQLPSYLSDEQAFVLAIVLQTIKPNEKSISYNVIKDVYASLDPKSMNKNKENIQLRKEIETLVRSGLLMKTNLRPLQIALGPIFFLEFSEFAQNTILEQIKMRMVL